MSYDPFWDDPRHDMRQEALAEPYDDLPTLEEEERYDAMRDAANEERVRHRPRRAFQKPPRRRFRDA